MLEHLGGPKPPRFILERAKREIEEENFRALVEREKERLRKHVPFWHRLFPFIIKIERRK